MKVVERMPDKQKEVLSEIMEAILEDWNEGSLSDVIIIAGCKDGKSYVSSSMCATEMIANLEVAKTHAILGGGS